MLPAAMAVSPHLHGQQPAEVARDIESVCAGERQRFELPSLQRFDADGDRRISAAEAAQCPILADLFERLDLDASGTLSASEYRVFPDVWRRRARTLEDPTG